jgi:hypothetical protein
MKKITKPKQNEEAVYYSDFSGECFGNYPPPIQLTIEFNYGSKYDGSKFTFDLDDKDIDDVLFMLKGKLNNDTKKDLRKRYANLNDKYDDSVQVRDWTDCDYICNEKLILERLL